MATTKQLAYHGFSARLNQACDLQGLPRRGRAKALGALVEVGYKGAEKWLKAQSMPDMAHSAILARELRVSFEWLMTGRGNSSLISAANTEGQAIAALWPSLPEELKTAIRAILSCGSRIAEPDDKASKIRDPEVKPH